MIAKKFTIAYAPDDNYVNLTIVSMSSAVENMGADKIKFVILYSDLSEVNIKKFEEFEKAVETEVFLAKIDAKEFENLPLSSWVSVQAWFRIKIPEICKDASRVLYLDCDTLVASDISELWKFQLDDVYVGVVRDVWNVEKYVKRLKMKSCEYFNSGMLLINCSKWRNEKLADKLFEYASTHNVEFCDQDTLNKVIDEKKLMLHPRYNYLEPWWRGNYHEYTGKWEIPFSEAAAHPSIIHFTGLKPSRKGCGHSFAQLWREYASRSIVAKEIASEYENSEIPAKKKISFFKKIFFVGNEYNNGKKRKVLQIFGLKIKL